MSIKIKSTLNRFADRVKNKNLNNFNDRLADAVATEGKEMASSRFGASGVMVDKGIVHNGQTKIIASGQGVAYIEFGTGVIGRGQYPDPSKLPTQTLRFSSRGREQETQGWQYNYFKEQHKNDPSVKDWTGSEPKAPMYYTARDLRNELGRIAKKTIKGEQ